MSRQSQLVMLGMQKVSPFLSSSSPSFSKHHVLAGGTFSITSALTKEVCTYSHGGDAGDAKGQQTWERTTISFCFQGSVQNPWCKEWIGGPLCQGAGLQSGMFHIAADPCLEGMRLEPPEASNDERHLHHLIWRAYFWV